MLAQRVATALVLLALWLPTLWMHNPWPFIVLTLLFISLAAWEWGRLNGLGSAGAWGCGLALAAGGLLAAWAAPAPGHLFALWGLAALGWIAGGAWVLRTGPTGWPGVPRLARIALGLTMLAVAWWALAQARIVGVNYLLSVLCVVWMADIAAYFGGRAFGRHKLAPRISPGKSWEGVASGMLGVLVLAAIWTAIDVRVATDSASLFTQLRQRFGVGPMVLALLGLTALSVVGDLFESLVKRAVGVKDSSALLPGHGGVLDRIDALLPVLPCALALTTL
ncbi:MAG TPA: phosphatidate cytidylyltransferase [Burkholderiaceae bacterium]|nr:phosphatidate cytidylyltransferase [Burkholderiaceae bacterium]HSC01334.1 phosphatidate cytidylyltransferase [Burkholderiaceae bacterium]